MRLAIEGPIAWLRIDRAAKRNALDQAMWDAVPALVENAMVARGVRLLVLASATPGVFCAGADIGELAGGAGDPAWRARNRAAIRGAQVALARAPKPTIAAVDGDCVGGGCGLALACDLRVATPRARFGITPARLGLAYPLHDVKLLVDLVGPAEARRILFMGALIDAEEARRIGLVQSIADDLDAGVAAMATPITAASPWSVAANKATIARVLGGAVDDDAESAALFDRAFDGADFAEGLAAFAERRAPRFADPA